MDLPLGLGSIKSFVVRSWGDYVLKALWMGLHRWQQSRRERDHRSAEEIEVDGRVDINRKKLAL
jgi:hypothetical protein